MFRAVGLFYVLSSGFLGFFRTGRGSLKPEYAPGQVTFDAASDLLVGLALGAALLDVVARLGVMGHPAGGSHV